MWEQLAVVGAVGCEGGGLRARGCLWWRCNSGGVGLVWAQSGALSYPLGCCAAPYVRPVQWRRPPGARGVVEVSVRSLGETKLTRVCMVV